MVKKITVFEVMWQVPDGHPQAYGGAGGDGTFIERFRQEDLAQAFAKGRFYCGQPAVVGRYEASRELARRWGVA